MNPERVFDLEYRHDPRRRKHRHRCIQCQRIVASGERVTMVLLSRGSKVVHKECDDLHPDGITWTDAFRAWADQGKAA